MKLDPANKNIITKIAYPNIDIFAYLCIKANKNTTKHNIINIKASILKILKIIDG